MSGPPTPETGEVARTVRRLGLTGVLAVISATLPAVGFAVLAFSFNIVGPWLRDQEMLGRALYVLVFALTAGLAVLPTHIQAALGGWAFGFAAGFPLAMAGVLGSALLGYELARWASGDRVVRLIDEKPKWRAVYEALLCGSPWRVLLIVTLIRTALTPFALTNLVFAATRVRRWAVVLGTLVGMAPRTGAAVFMAVGLREVTAESASQRWVWGLGLAATVAAVVVIGQLANRAVVRVTASRSAE